MARRSFVLGFAAATLLAVGVFVGVQLGSTKTAVAAPQSEPRPIRAGFVCISELTYDYEKWREQMTEHNKTVEKDVKRLELMKGILDRALLDVQSASPENREERTARWQEEAKKYSEAVSDHNLRIQNKATEQWAELYADVSAAVREVAVERQLDVVYAFTLHPDRPVKVPGFTPGHKAVTLLGKEQTLPLYLRDEVDLTAELVKRLNANADRKK